MKRQVFELLSALCVYSSEGYSRALEALEHYKNTKGERYRFKVVIDELVAANGNGGSSGKAGSKAGPSPAAVADANGYKTVLFAFINCLIISTPQLKDRNRVRNEFVGLKLLDVIKSERLRGTGNKRLGLDADLQVQLDVFDEQKESDEAQVRPLAQFFFFQNRLWFDRIKTSFDLPVEVDSVHVSSTWFWK